MIKTHIEFCPICGSTSLTEATVLWPELIDSWQLSEYEVGYINRQQGYHCQSCFNNLRAMGLASAITRQYNFNGPFQSFCESDISLKVLEVNRAGSLTPFLSKLHGHRLIEYPEFDMMNLEIDSASYDLVIHSDTLEHIPHPDRALSECKRVLKPDGKCIFTIPIIVDRLTRSRVGLPDSFHGEANINATDQVVYSEFGADFWKCVFKAGFSACEILAHEYPASLTIVAKN